MRAAVSRRGASRFRLVTATTLSNFVQRADSCPVTVYKNVTSLKKSANYKTFTRRPNNCLHWPVLPTRWRTDSVDFFAHTNPESLQDPEHQYDNWSPS